MITVEPAAREDIVRLVELEAGLFRADAGRHDPFADTTWPYREGRQDFERLLANPQALVLVARDGVTVVGHLVGYLSESSPTRQRVTYGVLRSVYVEAEHRNSTVGAQLTEAFIAWARTNGCAEAHVESYEANEAAQRFYERLGFQPRSVSRALRLSPRRGVSERRDADVGLLNPTDPVAIRDRAVSADPSVGSPQSWKR